jgi:hypothetical protein
MLAIIKETNHLTTNQKLNLINSIWSSIPKEDLIKPLSAEVRSLLKERVSNLKTAKTISVKESKKKLEAKIAARNKSNRRKPN